MKGVFLRNEPTDRRQTNRDEQVVQRANHHLQGFMLT